MAFSLLGLLVALPLDAVQVSKGVLYYADPWIFGQAWWATGLLVVAAIGMGESHHWLRKLLSVRAVPKMEQGKFLTALFVFFSAYIFSIVFFKNITLLALFLLLTYIVGCLLAWQEPARLLIAQTFGVIVVAGAAELFVINLGGFSYSSPSFWGMPVWLPLLYINTIFVAAYVDNYISAHEL